MYKCVLLRPGYFSREFYWRNTWQFITTSQSLGGCFYSLFCDGNSYPSQGIKVGAAGMNCLVNVWPNDDTYQFDCPAYLRIVFCSARDREEDKRL